MLHVTLTEILHVRKNTEPEKGGGGGICLDRVHIQHKKNSTEMTDILSLSLKTMRKKKMADYWLPPSRLQSPSLVRPPLNSLAAMYPTLTLYSGVKWSRLLMSTSLQTGLSGLCL